MSEDEESIDLIKPERKDEEVFESELKKQEIKIESLPDKNKLRPYSHQQKKDIQILKDEMHWLTFKYLSPKISGPLPDI